MATDGNRRALFVSALATGATVLDAAGRAGISERTAHRWFRQPDVAAEVERLRVATIDHTREVLLGMVDEAAGWLRKAGDSDSPAAWTSAARVVFAQASRYHDLTAVEQQLDELRQAVVRIEAARRTA